MVENVANMAAYVLPVSQKFINGVPVPQGRKTLRMKEKYIILLVFVTFGLVCFGAFFFLPDLRDRVRLNNIRGVDEMIIPRGGIDKGQVLKHDDDHAHLKGERQNFLVQVGRDRDLAKELNMPKQEAEKHKESIDMEKKKLADQLKVEKERKAEEEKAKERKVETEHEGGEGGQGGEPSDPEVRKKRDKVREVRNRDLDV